MSALSGRSPRDENRAPASFGVGLNNPSLAVPMVVDETTGQLQVSANGIVTGTYDTVNVTYPSNVEEVYEYVNGGNTLATVTVTYTDPTKVYLASIVRT
jgi:hypothetical protein